MTLTLRILLILSSVLASCTVVRRIRKSKMQIDDAVFWVLFSLVLIVLAVFPHIIYWISIRTEGYSHPPIYCIYSSSLC